MKQMRILLGKPRRKVRCCVDRGIRHAVVERHTQATEKLVPSELKEASCLCLLREPFLKRTVDGAALRGCYRTGVASSAQLEGGARKWTRCC